MSESKSVAQAEISQNLGELQHSPDVDVDSAETQEWISSLEYVLQSKGPERVKFLIDQLRDRAAEEGVPLSSDTSTPYVNTIPPHEQPAYPGNRELERRIKSIIRWNAMAMVVRANKRPGGVGGHISTFASSATLYEVAFNHFFQGRGEDGYSGDSIYFQGHASPGMYSRAYLEGRLSDENLDNFRRELAPGGGLSSYPHPWLMPGFWEYPTVSMGLGPIMAIYQARFNEYLNDRGIKDTKGQKVWAFLGDGECDEPETLGAIGLASREKLDNLIFVINCNLQRLDGPVRGNSKIIQELESIFHGAGWNVIKVVWGGEWDELLARDTTGLLAKRMNEVVDGQYQKYTSMPGSYIREHFFGKYPELLELVKHLSDEKLEKIRRGGHDPEKVYAAYHRATTLNNGKPTVILAKTVKGYGLGEAGEGRNVAHNQKKMNEAELLEFRTRFGIPISDEKVGDAPFYKPPANSNEIKYLKDRRESLGGPVPSRPTEHPTLEVPSLDEFRKLIGKLEDKECSTTFAVVQMLTAMCRDKKIGKYVVPIVPDESRTFGMEGMFRQFGIYAHAGQLYEPMDSDQISFYKEAQDGQILEEGITECGSMSSFNAAGTAYSCHGVNMIPLYIYYSMFGFQRVGDSIWAAADMRAKGFLVGGTAGRTTLNGEGLQHQDGHSLLNAIAFPTVRAYDPAFAYEVIVIIQEGLQRMYADGEECMYYITAENDPYTHPKMPEGCEEGIIKGMYKFNSREVDGAKARVQLFGSGAILNSALKAQEILAEKYNIASDVWSVTSYTLLRREAHSVERWNRLHPTETPRKSYLEEVLEGVEGPFISASDYVRALGEQLTPWIPGDYYVLGTDGMGRSETREALRRHFEVDAESITIAALGRLAKAGTFEAADVAQAIKDLDYDPDKVDPYFA
ncbi:MAG: pyruvate dehydrogenase (acetyl-transferring), homodimeric type [Rhodopirellula sp.]|jgi:pyruvate dehydrogenase E1 component|uniref:pyruvate dehydrogenase (acetyl-transferring), homodimeric type n=1 Tax=Rhodopirellula TaxID=265488 RepID=UPI000C49BFD2|nr:pyruvate dehydrogenase (acetyl-transferring), homodimeric type [Rhodopirellula sp. UBA1907]MAP09436.1 pyruvate dehydrogenase (acetyl-transferring), homodimeric type [Rhodopirellula sp.]MCR9210369.1 pyruvate dehydrogenase (acetyl-transferring), homodimeric type [bacterium]